MIVTTYTDFRHRFSTSGTIGIDGYEEWPVAELGSGGFSGGFTTVSGSPIARPILAFPITVSCNSGAADGGSAFDWYLSQRTDDPSLQWISIAQYSGTQSGTVTLALTAKCVSDLGLSSPTASLTEDELIAILKNCDLYVQRRSDDAIQVLQLLQYTLSDFPA